MIKPLFLISVIGLITLIPFISAQEFEKATWQETASIIYDFKHSKSVIGSIGFETTSNDEIRIPDELLEKISSYQHIKSIVFTNHGQCIVGVTSEEQCLMINIDYFGIKGDGGIKTIQTTAKQIGDELIPDVNQLLGLETIYHSVYVHVADEANIGLGTSGMVSGRGTVSAVYTMEKQETDFLFVDLAGTLIPREIRNDGGFYEVAKQMAYKSGSTIALGIIPESDRTMFLFKVSTLHDNIDNTSLIEPLKFLNVEELIRSNYFEDTFTPLNSILHVVVIPESPSKIDAIKTHAITDVTSLENISQKGWFLTAPAGDKIDMRFLFGMENSVSADELKIEIGPWNMEEQMEFFSVENIPEEQVKQSTEELTQDNQEEDQSQYVIIVIIIAAAIGAAIFYLKGYKKTR